MDAKQEGALLEQIHAIKENTDKIPDMATMLAIHEVKINALIPKVASHETSIQRAYGVAGLVTLVGGFFSYIIGQRNGQ